MHKALIIDDDAQNLRLLTVMLGRFNYDVYTAQRGDIGVDMAHDLLPDIILVDLLMPKATYDGLEVTQLLRGHPKFHLTPIIAISAADAHTIKDQLNNQMFTDFIQKPITLDKLEIVFSELNRRNTA